MKASHKTLTVVGLMLTLILLFLNGQALAAPLAPPQPNLFLTPLLLIGQGALTSMAVPGHWVFGQHRELNRTAFAFPCQGYCPTGDPLDSHFTCHDLVFWRPLFSLCRW